MQPHSGEIARAHGFAGATARPRRRPATLWLLAGLALGLGLLVYLCDRRPQDALLLPRFAALGTGPLFGASAGWLPSFIHPFAFSLLSAAALHRPAAPGRAPYGLCAFWWAVNLAFEVGQHPRFSTAIADALQGLLGMNAFSAALQRYFLRGRFDWGDVAALSAGALAAAAVLRFLHASEGRHDV